MSVSIAEIKSILINSYSIMYGNIDPKYITMTRFFEKSPGEFDYTCEVLVPQTPALASVVAQVETKIAEIETFNQTKAPDAPSFVESQLVKNIAKATEKVLGTSNTSLFETSDTGEAVVAVKTFGNPSKSVSKKRKVVVSTDNVPPVIESMTVDNVRTYMYRESVSGDTEVFRRLDGSRYQVQNNQHTTELSGPDSTFVGYRLVGYEGQPDFIEAKFDSFARATITGASLVSHDTLLDFVVDTVVPTSVYAVLTTFPEWNDSNERSFLGNTNTTLSASAVNLGANVLAADQTVVSAESLSAWYVHLFADNDPFFVHDTLRIERPEYDTNPYIQKVSVNYETPDVVDVTGTVYDAVKDIYVVLVTVADTVDSNFARAFGNKITVNTQKHTLTNIDTRLYYAFADTTNPSDRRPIVEAQTYRVVIWADSKTVHTETFTIPVETRTVLSVANVDAVYPPTATLTEGGYTVELVPSTLTSETPDAFTSVRLGPPLLNAAEGYVHDFTLRVVTQQDPTDVVLFFGNNRLTFTITNNGSTFVSNAWRDGQQSALLSPVLGFLAPDYWRLTMVATGDAMVQLFDDPERTSLVMYGYLSEVVDSWLPLDIPFEIGFGCSAYTPRAPDRVTFEDLIIRDENRGPGVFVESEGNVLLSVRNVDWTPDAALLKTYDLSVDSFSAHYGHSCALSADATVAVVGGYKHDLVGGASVMEYNPGLDRWGKYDSNGVFVIGAKHNLVRTTTWTDTNMLAGRLGMAVDISADGKTLLISGDVSNSDTKGIAYVYQYHAGEWGKFVSGVFVPGQGHNLSLTGTTGRYGQKCALSADGKVAVISGVYRCAFVWKFQEDGTWTLQQDLTLNTTEYGASVAVSADGSRIVVGRAPSSSFGELYIWNYDPVTEQYVHTHTLLKTSTGGRFGQSCAISADGKVVMGAGYNTNTSGCAFVFHYNEETDQWGSFSDLNGFTNNVPHNLSVTVDAKGRYGTQCALSNYGNTAMVTGPYGGGTYVWTYQNNAWTLTNVLLPTDYVTVFGTAMDMSSDGTTVLASGPTGINYGGRALMWRGHDLGQQSLFTL